MPERSVYCPVITGHMSSHFNKDNGDNIAIATILTDGIDFFYVCMPYFQL